MIITPIGETVRADVAGIADGDVLVWDATQDGFFAGSAGGGGNGPVAPGISAASQGGWLPAVGSWVDPFASQNFGTSTLVSSSYVYLWPMYSGPGFKADRVGYGIAAVTGTITLTFVVYDTDAGGNPTDLLYSAGFSVSSTGDKASTIDFTFLPGKLYWIGIHAASSAITVRTWNNGTKLGATGATGTTYAYGLRSLFTSATPPDPFGSYILQNTYPLRCGLRRGI